MFCPSAPKPFFSDFQTSMCCGVIKGGFWAHKNSLNTPLFYLLKCMYQTRKVSGHVLGYQLCLFLLFLYMNFLLPILFEIKISNICSKDNFCQQTSLENAQIKTIQLNSEYDKITAMIMKKIVIDIFVIYSIYMHLFISEPYGINI